MPVPYSELNYIQRAFVDYNAISGLVTDDDGIRKMTVNELAQKLNIDRTSLYKNRDRVPNFWDLVAERRQQISPRSRLSRVHETWYLKAVKGDWQHMNAWLLNFDSKYIPPTQKVESTLVIKGFSDLIVAAEQEGLIDGELVSATTNHQRTSGQDTAALPAE